MGLDLTSAPLGMWNRGLVVMGGRVWGMMFGRALRHRGGPGWGGVPFGGGRMGQGGSMREGLAVCPGWWWWGGEATALGPTWTLANSAITPHSEQLAHKGYSGTCSPSIGHGALRSSPLVCLNTTRQPGITPAERC